MLLLTEETLPDIEWQKVQQCNKKLCITVHPVEFSEKPNSCKTLPRRVPDMQDADKLSEPVASRLHIETHIGRSCCKI